MPRFLNNLIVSTLALLLVLSVPVNAGVLDHVTDALRFTNFVLDTDHDDVSNTSIAVAASNFQGNTIDLGDFDVTLAGPVSAVFRTGGRGIPTIDVTLSTGLLNVNPNRVVTVGDAQPLSYVFNTDSGTNATSVAGNALLDARFQMNTFGSYDLKFQLSNRQTSAVDGRFDANGQNDFDFDIGPVNIEGNLFADLLATVTDPIFEAAGFENVFANFSGRTLRETQSQAVADALRTKVESGGTLNADDLNTVTELSLVSRILGDQLPDLSFVEAARAAGAAGAIPEPGTIVLLIGGAAWLRRRTRR